MRKLVIILLFFSQSVGAQAINKDSLWNAWENPNLEDSLRLKAIGRLAFYTAFSNPDSAFYLAQLQLDFATSIKNEASVADAFNTQGISYYLKGEFDKAIYYFDKSLKGYKRMNDMAGVGNLLNNISGVYVNMKSYDEALAYLLEGLDYFKETKYNIGLAMTYTNIGTVYVYKSEEIESVKKSTELLDSAYVFLQNGLTLSNEINYAQSKANSLTNLGVVHYYWGNLDSAKMYLTQSLDLKTKANNQEGIAEDLIYMSKIYRKEGKYREATNFANKAFDIGEALELTVIIKNASLSLYETYKVTGNDEQALMMFENYITAKDSVEKKENQNEVIRQQFRYEYDKQHLADSLGFIQQKEIDDLAHEAELKHEAQQRYFLYGGVGFLLLLGGLIFRSYQRKKKDNIIISAQKEEVEKQKDIIQEAHQEIKDSINYAKRIQSAILPPSKSVSEHLPNSFILYKPKDIVAGDFYWLEPTSDGVLFAAADCTGHGVPGAMVSVVCNNALNRSVREFGLTDPADILNQTREIVIQEFEKSEEDVKDGMDIALCYLLKNKLVYAGANNPLWVIRKESDVIEEIKANKQPIGKFENPQRFISHMIELNEGDTFYIFSDGFVDQFGGESGKKFKASNLKKLLLLIQDQSMDQQLKELNQTFESWKGPLDQIDDVCVIGVRI